MNILKSLALVMSLTMLAGCSDPKIDVSSDENMKTSVQKVRSSLPESKKGEFDNAMKVLALSNLDMKNIFTQGTTGAGEFEGKVKESLKGKTGEQVIAEADRILKERKERERQQALKEIQELETKKIAAESSRGELQKFQVIRSRFYMQEQEYGGKQPIIELTVKNGSGKAVSRAYFEGTVASPGRSVPWHKDVFNYSIAGGIEPGEEANWTLAPNRFSDWGKVDVPADAVFTVTVEQIDGADGKSLYSTMEFSENDNERLSDLKKKYSTN